MKKTILIISIIISLNASAFLGWETVAKALSLGYLLNSASKVLKQANKVLNPLNPLNESRIIVSKQNIKNTRIRKKLRRNWLILRKRCSY